MEKPGIEPKRPDLMTDARKFAEKLEALATEADKLGYVHESRILTELANDLEEPGGSHRC